MDRSIEGDSSIRVGEYQRQLTDAFHFYHIECLAKHSEGHHGFSHSFGVMSLSYCTIIFVTYVIHLILVAIV